MCRLGRDTAAAAAGRWYDPVKPSIIECNNIKCSINIQTWLKYSKVVIISVDYVIDRKTNFLYLVQRHRGCCLCCSQEERMVVVGHDGGGYTQCNIKSVKW